MLKETNTKFRTDLRSLIDQDPSPFSSEIVKSWNDYEREIDGFDLKQVHHENATIDVRNVVGSNHGTYVSQPWQYLIFHGKYSSDRLKELSNNPEYYLEEITCERRPNLHKVGQDLFIVGDGNNRTIIAKFFFYYNQDKIAEPLLRNVILTEHFVDWNSLSIKKEIEFLLTDTRFSHLSLTLITDNFLNSDDHKYRWHLFNNKLKGEDRSIKLTKDELPSIRDALKSDNLLKRVLGLGYSKNMRKTIFY